MTINDFISKSIESIKSGIDKANIGLTYSKCVMPTEITFTLKVIRKDDCYVMAQEFDIPEHINTIELTITMRRPFPSELKG